MPFEAHKTTKSRHSIDRMYIRNSLLPSRLRARNGFPNTFAPVFHAILTRSFSIQPSARLRAQTGGRVGQDRGVAVRDCRCADDRAARAGHREQLQLLLPSRDRSGGDAEPELQPRDQLPVSARYYRWVVRSRER